MRIVVLKKEEGVNYSMLFLVEHLLTKQTKNNFAHTESTSSPLLSLNAWNYFQRWFYLSDSFE